MTTRERWTVYPLVFLALGLAFRAALLSEERLAEAPEEFAAGRIECRELIVRDADDQILFQVPDAEYARQDSNLQPSVPKTDALSN